MSSEPRNISITRQGQQFGPYPEDVAKQLLAEGKLLASDLAWHPETEGWKPLSEVLDPTQSQDAPPPPPPASAVAPPKPHKSDEPLPDTKVHISRRGERHGPYTYATAKEFLAGGQLLPTDSAWHDGLSGWKPLGEVMGGGGSGGGKNCPRCSTTLEAKAMFCPQCGYNLQTGQGIQIVPILKKLAGSVNCSPEVERFKQSQLKNVGIMMIVGCALPLVFIGDKSGNIWKFLGGALPGNNAGSIVYFPNFQAINDFESAVFLLGPLVLGITMVAMVKSTKDPIRSSVVVGLWLLFYLISTDGKFGRMGFLPGGNFQGDNFQLFFLGWLGLIMGCRLRQFRPFNLPIYIIALAGAGLLCLSWLIGKMPLLGVFKAFKGDKISALTGLVFMGMQIAAAVYCFTTTRDKSYLKVEKSSMLSIKLLVGSILVATALFYCNFTFGVLQDKGSNLVDKIGPLVTMLLALIKVLAWQVGFLLVLPIVAGDLLITLIKAPKDGALESERQSIIGNVWRYNPTKDK